MIAVTQASDDPRLLVFFAVCFFVILLTFGVVALNVWQLVRCLATARRYGPVTTLAKVGWIFSVASWLTGPFALLGAPVGIGLGAMVLWRGARPTDRISGWMAIANGVYVLLAAAALAVATLQLRRG